MNLTFQFVFHQVQIYWIFPPLSIILFARTYINIFPQAANQGLDTKPIATNIISTGFKQC